MSESTLAEDSSPDGLSSGVKRFNRVPLALAGSFLLIAIIALSWAVYERSVVPTGGPRSSLINPPDANLDDEGRSDDMTRTLFPDEANNNRVEIQSESGGDGLVSRQGTQQPASQRQDSVGEFTNEQSFQGSLFDQGAGAEAEAFRLEREAIALEQAIASETGVSTGEEFGDDNDGSKGGAGDGDESDDYLDNLDDAYASKLDSLSNQLSGVGSDQDVNLRQRKQEFLDEDRGEYPYSVYQRVKPLHKTEIKTGSVISGMIISAISSDLPGMVLAQISLPVRDSQTGRHILIPSGSKLIGEYDSHIAYGQGRLLIVWRRIQFPDSSTLALPSMPGVDSIGQMGVSDEVDNRFWRTLGSATLVSVIGAAAQLSQPSDDPEDGRRGRSDELSASLGRAWSEHTGEIIKRGLNVQPTLRVRSGFRFNILVNQDIILDPYYGD